MDGARHVFNEQGYYRASISEISRHCGVSQGTFYQYFKNKEQLLIELHDEIVDRFWERADGLDLEGADFESRLRRVVGLLYDHTRENLYFHRILGEFELIDQVTIAYFASLARYYRRFFRGEAALGNVRPLDANLIAYGLMGVVYFNLLDWGEGAETYDPARLLDLTATMLLRGIGGPAAWKRPADLSQSSRPDRAEEPALPEAGLTQGQRTRQALFQAAERVFGRHGFNRANVSEITREAGVAQGTFYVHFRSKQDLMEGYVRYLSRELRRSLSRATKGHGDRRTQEQEGMVAFFRFLEAHRRIYRVVGQSETIGPGLGMWYYHRLSRGYVAGFGPGLARGEVQDLPAVFLARSLMGLNHMIGVKWLVWDSSPHAHIPRPLVGEAVSWVLEGLAP